MNKKTCRQKLQYVGTIKEMGMLAIKKNDSGLGIAKIEKKKNKKLMNIQESEKQRCKIMKKWRK